MAAQALYLRWRPRTFEQMVGQTHVTRTLKNALATNRVAHAYLFGGPRGTGKTSTARLLAKAVNCVGETEEKPCGECRICRAVEEGRMMDLIEIDAASNRGIDEIRDLREKVGFRPGEARIKFYIIDEVHMLTKEAFNALLKTLEEPPDHVIFVLATTEPHKIPATIISRCQRFDFRRIPLKDMVDWLTHIAQQESMDIDAPALEYIARQGGGSLRDSISLLDQLSAYDSDTITLERVQSVLGAVASEAVIALVDCLIRADVAAGLEQINRVIADGTDVRQFTREVVEYLRQLLLLKMGPGAQLLRAAVSDTELGSMQDQVKLVDGLWLLRAIQLFNDAALDMQAGFLPQLPLELALVEAVMAGQTAKAGPAPAPAATTVVSRPAAATVAPARTGGAESRPAATGADASQPPAPAAPAAPAPEPVRPQTQEKAADYMPPPVLRDTPAGASLSLAEVEDKWRDFLSQLRNVDKTAQSYMNSVTLVGVEGNHVIVEAQSDLIRGRIEKTNIRNAVDPCLSQMIGVPVHLRCVVAGEYIPTQTGPTSRPTPPAQPIVAEPPTAYESSQAGNLDDDEEDAMLAEALNLGGRIREESSDDDDEDD